MQLERVNYFCSYCRNYFSFCIARHKIRFLLPKIIGLQKRIAMMCSAFVIGTTSMWNLMYTSNEPGIYKWELSALLASRSDERKAMYVSMVLVFHPFGLNAHLNRIQFFHLLYVTKNCRHFSQIICFTAWHRWGNVHQFRCTANDMHQWQQKHQRQPGHQTGTGLE